MLYLHAMNSRTHLNHWKCRYRSTVCYYKLIHGDKEKRNIINVFSNVISSTTFPYIIVWANHHITWCDCRMIKLEKAPRATIYEAYLKLLDSHRRILIELHSTVGRSLDILSLPLRIHWFSWSMYNSKNWYNEEENDPDRPYYKLRDIFECNFEDLALEWIREQISFWRRQKLLVNWVRLIQLCLECR